MGAYRLYRSADAVFIESSDAPGLFRQAGPEFSFDALFTSSRPFDEVAALYEGVDDGVPFPTDAPLQAPLGRQEVWAAGVPIQRGR